MLFQKQHTMKLLLLLLLVIYFKDTKAHVPARKSNDNNFTSNEIDNVGSRDTHYSCIYDYRSCHCFTDLLVNFTSNISIYIKTDMILSSVIQFTHLKNIAIIGYNNPTVQCGYSGGLHFVSCHNVTIEGITWD